MILRVIRVFAGLICVFNIILSPGCRQFSYPYQRDRLHGKTRLRSDLRCAESDVKFCPSLTR